MSEPTFLKQDQPRRFPTTDGKAILEHLGQFNGFSHLSVAHMLAPPGWSEPHQTPEFGEVTLMVRGRKRVEIDGQTVTLEAGQSLWVRRGARVRYANPFDEPAEYWSVCLPAFSPETVHREETA